LCSFNIPATLHFCANTTLCRSMNQAYSTPRSSLYSYFINYCYASCIKTRGC
jgi:hypothetical protein